MPGRWCWKSLYVCYAWLCMLCMVQIYKTYNTFLHVSGENIYNSVRYSFQFFVHCFHNLLWDARVRTCDIGWRDITIWPWNGGGRSSKPVVVHSVQVSCCVQHRMPRLPLDNLICSLQTERLLDTADHFCHGWFWRWIRNLSSVFFSFVQSISCMFKMCCAHLVHVGYQPRTHSVRCRTMRQPYPHFLHIAMFVR